MILVWGISRWTNPWRSSARHIDAGNGMPLCHDKRNVSSWEHETGEPTCKRCIAIYNRMKSGKEG